MKYFLYGEDGLYWTKDNVENERGLRTKQPRIMPPKDFGQGRYKINSYDLVYSTLLCEFDSIEELREGNPELFI